MDRIICRERTYNVIIRFPGPQGAGTMPIVQDATPDVSLYNVGQEWQTVSYPVGMYKLKGNGSGGKVWAKLAEEGV